jgi:hypothetical protein
MAPATSRIGVTTLTQEGTMKGKLVTWVGAALLLAVLLALPMLSSAGTQTFMGSVTRDDTL